VLTFAADNKHFKAIKYLLPFVLLLEARQLLNEERFYVHLNLIFKIKQSFNGIFRVGSLWSRERFSLKFPEFKASCEENIVGEIALKPVKFMAIECEPTPARKFHLKHLPIDCFAKCD
jgi:hypothetical protein